MGLMLELKGSPTISLKKTGKIPCRHKKWGYSGDYLLIFSLEGLRWWLIVEHVCWVYRLAYSLLWLLVVGFGGSAMKEKTRCIFCSLDAISSWFTRFIRSSTFSFVFPTILIRLTSNFCRDSVSLGKWKLLPFTRWGKVFSHTRTFFALFRT